MRNKRLIMAMMFVDRRDGVIVQQETAQCCRDDGAEMHQGEVVSRWRSEHTGRACETAGARSAG